MRKPAMPEVTSTEMVQIPEAATVPPDKSTLDEPAVALNVPPQVLFAFGGLATVKLMPAKLSVNASAVTATKLALLSMVKVKVLTSPAAIGSFVKALLKAGGLGLFTVIEAEAVVPVPVLPVNAEVVLVCVPDTSDFT